MAKPIDVDRVLKDNEKWARGCIQDHGEIGSGIILGISEDGTHYICPMLYTNSVEREAFLNQLTTMFAEKSVEQYFVTSETYYLSGSIKEASDRKNIEREMDQFRGHLEDAPNRKEGVMLLYVSRTEARQRMYPLTRDKKGKPTMAQEPEMDATVDLTSGDDSMAIGGEMAHLLRGSDSYGDTTKIIARNLQRHTPKVL